MRELTQTSLDPGNCWQTCVACILDLDPESMPSQIVHDAKREPTEDGGFRWVGPHYITVLNAYLREHHGLAYLEVHYPIELFLHAVQIRESGLHLMTGRTVRSATNGNQRHVVVGERGSVRWDPHPSRAGLTEDINYAFLVPFPESWRRSDLNTKSPCVCPSCAVPEKGAGVK